MPLAMVVEDDWNARRLVANVLTLEGFDLLALFPPSEQPAVIVLSNGCHEGDQWVNGDASYHCVTKPIDAGMLKSAIRKSEILTPEESPEEFREFDPLIAGAPRSNQDALNVRIPSRIADVERELINATLRKYSGSKVKTASALGISLKTLYNRLREYSGGA